MKIKTNTIPLTQIYNHQVNALVFEKTKPYHDFIEAIEQYKISKTQHVNEGLRILKDNFEEIAFQKINIICVDCAKIKLEQEKDFKESLSKLIESQLKEAETSQKLLELQILLEELGDLLKIEFDNFQLEVTEVNLSKTNLLKLLPFEVVSSSETLLHLQLRQAYIEIMQSAGKKENIFLVLNPESNLGIEDIPKFIKYLHNMNETIIVISSHLQVLSEIKLSNLTFIKKNHTIYDLKSLKEEYLHFFGNQKDNIDERVFQLAYFDFMSKKMLIDEKLHSFLE